MLVEDDLHDDPDVDDPDVDGPQSGISQQNHRWLMLSGGAALVVIVLLVLAVLHTARSSTTPSGVPGTTSAPSSTSSSATRAPYAVEHVLLAAEPTDQCGRHHRGTDRTDRTDRDRAGGADSGSPDLRPVDADDDLQSLCDDERAERRRLLRLATVLRLLAP